MRYGINDLEYSWMSDGTHSEGGSALDVSGLALHCSENSVGVQCLVLCVPSTCYKQKNADCRFSVSDMCSREGPLRAEWEITA